MMSIATQTRPSMGRDPVRVLDFRSPSRGKRRGSEDQKHRWRVSIHDGEFRMTAGTLWVWGRGSCTLSIGSGSEVAPVGASGYLIARIHKTALSGTVVAQTSAPNPLDATYYELPICEYTVSGDITTVTQPQRITQDIHLGLAL